MDIINVMLVVVIIWLAQLFVVLTGTDQSSCLATITQSDYKNGRRMRAFNCVFC